MKLKSCVFGEQVRVGIVSHVDACSFPVDAFVSLSNYGISHENIVFEYERPDENATNGPASLSVSDRRVLWHVWSRVYWHWGTCRE